MSSLPGKRIHPAARHTLAVAVSASVLCMASAVSAQGIPTTELNKVPAGPPPPRAPVVINNGAAADGAAKGAAQAGGVYHLDDYQSDRPTAQWDLKVHGAVPESHVVRRGDTLWDISWFYFNNPWEWPKVWSYNPSITSPHWIYPGDLVRLYKAGFKPVIKNADPDPDSIAKPASAAPQSYSVSVRQRSFISKDKIKYAATVGGSVDAKLLLSDGDTIYLTYPAGNPPKVGKRYAVFKTKKHVRHPTSHKVVGAYVYVVGEVEIVSVKKGKRARALIKESVDVIERGMRVGTLQRTFKNVVPVPNARNLQGTIVAMVDKDQLIGNRQIVFIDLGKQQKVKVGNRLYVVRRGDAFAHGRRDPRHGIGQDDRRFPARAVAEVIVIEVGENSSVAMIIASVKEAGVGDMVLMRKAR